MSTTTMPHPLANHAAATDALVALAGQMAEGISDAATQIGVLVTLARLKEGDRIGPNGPWTVEAQEAAAFRGAAELLNETLMHLDSMSSKCNVLQRIVGGHAANLDERDRRLLDLSFEDNTA